MWSTITTRVLFFQSTFSHKSHAAQFERHGNSTAVHKCYTMQSMVVVVRKPKGIRKTMHSEGKRETFFRER